MKNITHLTILFIAGLVVCSAVALAGPSSSTETVFCCSISIWEIAGLPVDDTRLSRELPIACDHTDLSDIQLYISLIAEVSPAAVVLRNSMFLSQNGGSIRTEGRGVSIEGTGFILATERTGPDAFAFTACIHEQNRNWPDVYVLENVQDGQTILIATTLGDKWAVIAPTCTHLVAGEFEARGPVLQSEFSKAVEALVESDEFHLSFDNTLPPCRSND